MKGAAGDARAAECFDRAGNTRGIIKACRLRGVLQEAVDAFQAVLDNGTLADLPATQKAMAKVLLTDGRNSA